MRKTNVSSTSIIISVLEIIIESEIWILHLNDYSPVFCRVEIYSLISFFDFYVTILFYVTDISVVS